MDNTIKKPKYKLTYLKTEKNLSPEFFSCDLKSDHKRGRECTVYDSTNRDPPRTARERFHPWDIEFNFTLYSENCLGNFTENFLIDHFSIVIPPEPTNLTVENITENSAVLKWAIHPEVFNISGFNLNYTILLKSEYNDEWQVLNLSYDSLKNVSKLKDLEHPYTNFTLSMKVISSRANPYELDMWSPFTNTSFMTASRVPDRPPMYLPGGFHTTNYEDLTIYWQALEDWAQNGANLAYKFIRVKRNGIEV